MFDAFQLTIKDSQGASVHLIFTFYCNKDGDKDDEPAKGYRGSSRL